MPTPALQQKAWVWEFDAQRFVFTFHFQIACKMLRTTDGLPDAQQVPHMVGKLSPFQLLAAQDCTHPTPWPAHTHAHMPQAHRATRTQSVRGSTNKGGFQTVSLYTVSEQWHLSPLTRATPCGVDLQGDAADIVLMCLSTAALVALSMQLYRGYLLYSMYAAESTF